jgi:arylsulfatase A-like enzyme
MTSMPNVQSLLVKRGITLKNFFISLSLCCPSRATILRGQYAHNHGVHTNAPPTGGFPVFRVRGNEDSTVATWLQAAGYRTALFGKYLNGYPPILPIDTGPTYVPPGWNEWFSSFGIAAYQEFGYDANENGTVESYGNDPQDYGVDVIARKATDFILHGAPAADPFFMYVAPYAPHGPSTPAPRHAALFPSATAPRSDSFNEADVSDKPAAIRDLPLLRQAGQTAIDAEQRQRLRSLQSVDEMVGQLVSALQQTGQLDNTYIFFTSDNGYLQGQHRMSGKEVAYEESIRVSLIVRGPGVPAGETRDELSGNTDLAPTFADIAGAGAPDFVDGRSLLPLLMSRPPEAWRRAFLVEHWPGGGEQGAFATLPQYFGARTQDMIYIEYATGERELYDLRSDPEELTNIAASADPKLITRLSALLDKLKKCAGETCRSAEDASP